MIYKVSYVAIGKSHLGAIVNLDTAPRVGDRVQLGNEPFEVIEVFDLIPPRGDFAFLHATCQPIQEVEGVEDGTTRSIVYHPEYIHPTAYVSPNATVVGEVHIAAEASVWFGCVLRADNAPIIIGTRTNVQDLTVIHTDVGEPCTLGKGVIVGHRAVLHSTTIEDGALIGIGAIVLNGAVVGREALIGAGAVVPERAVIPPRHLALGIPARVVRELGDEEIERSHTLATHYVTRAQAFLTASKGG